MTFEQRLLAAAQQCQTRSTTLLKHFQSWITHLRSIFKHNVGHYKIKESAGAQRAEEGNLGSE